MIKVNEDACIGCGACQALVDEVFDINDDGFAYVKEDVDTSKYEEEVNEAIDNCPTGAIVKEEQKDEK